MAELVNGKFDKYLANSESVDIGNGYQIKSRFHELSTYRYDTPIRELYRNKVIAEVDNIPEGTEFCHLDCAQFGDRGFILKNAHDMFAKKGFHSEKIEESVREYLKEAKGYFLGNFTYIDPKLVIVAPDGEEIESPYNQFDRPIVRSDDKAAILEEQNLDLGHIERNIVPILKKHYEIKMKEAEKVFRDTEAKIDKVERQQKGFHFGDDNSPSGPGM